ncbi:hypothetical protein [Crocosphaera sp. XPORK-15E]|uniref:DUF7219 family protein n=1 Tax=Crocosphaera sp. XPORK-15E TaxID=3110247 RepID=UPI002B1F8E6A|nr:hypothetical protein [Crocosphaera sp. XPORK-15E]MEA5536639.1 hypothetical protein [Crocosphaera sp. XPORK-15E]
MDKSEFLNPKSPYYGQVKPEKLVFNSNLQEFVVGIGYICGLETNGKISPSEAYAQIHSLWEQLENSKHQLGIGDC